MRKRLGRRNVGQVCTRAPAERAAGRGDPQAGHLALRFAEQALVDGAVLGVDGHERTSRAARRRNPRRATGRVHLRGQRHDKVAAHHEAFLVRQGQHLARTQRLVTCAQAGGAHQRIHHHVNLGQAHQVDHGVHAEAPAALRAGLRADLFGNRVVHKTGIAYRQMAHAVFARLDKHITYARMHRQADDFQLVGMLANHIDRLRADRARGTKNNDALHDDPPNLLTYVRLPTPRQTGCHSPAPAEWPRSPQPKTGYRNGRASRRAREARCRSP